MIRIVLADDEPDILESTIMVLEAAGFEVIGVNRAEEILPTLLRVKPDILMQDVFMPDLDLPRLVQQVRAEAGLEGVRILIFTASVEGEDIRQQVHADGIIRKPFDADRIRETLERAVQTAPHGR